MEHNNDIEAVAGEYPRIFISYRREDSAGDAGRLFDRLQKRFGGERIFYDRMSLKPGTNFEEAIQYALSLCRVLIAVVGTKWLVDDHSRRRLDEENDLVRLEVVTAMMSRTPIIPVLVHGAQMPSSVGLPEALQGFSRIQAITLHDESYDQDMTSLLNYLETCDIPPLAVSAPPAATAGPLAGRVFRDDYIGPIVRRLENCHRELGADDLPIEVLLPELMKLFHRMTFRIEPLQKCHTQNWTGRLRGACQTWIVIKAYEENLGHVGSELQKELIQELLDEINRYCDAMAGNLFDPPIEFNSKDECVARCDDYTNSPVKVRFRPKKGMPGELSIKRRILEPCEQSRLKIVELADVLNATRLDRV